MFKSKYKIYHANLSFLDLMLNLILGFVFLFIISFVLIIVEKKEGIKTQAEFIITLSWDKDNIDDVDLWVKDPAGSIIYFDKKELGMTHLDRDDLGSDKDQMKDSDGNMIFYKFNQEISTIRAIIPGTWTVNVHMYNKNTKEPCNAEVKIEKINPLITIVAFDRFVMTIKGEERTIANFTVDSSGAVTDINRIPREIVKEELMQRQIRQQGGRE